MNIHAINALPAGLEMDLLVEKAMGEGPHDRPIHCPAGCEREYHCYDDHFFCHICEKDRPYAELRPANYSYGKKAMWRVVEWLIGEWGSFNLASRSGHDWYCGKDGVDQPEWTGRGTSPMLAVCRAALIAKGERV